MAYLEKHLVVKKSNIPGSGYGLFTTMDIPKGSTIIEYKGRVTTWKDVDHKAGQNPFIFYVNRNFVIDAYNYKKSKARYVNDARGIRKVKGLTNNCVYERVGDRIFIKATKKIPAGSELLVSYGKDYWDAIRYNKQLQK